MVCARRNDGGRFPRFYPVAEVLAWFELTHVLRNPRFYWLNRVELSREENSITMPVLLIIL